MSREIEVMARIICKPTANKGNCDNCGFKKQCSKFDDAADLYNAGYRKSVDVVREIFAEIEELLKIYTFPVVKIGVVEIVKEPFFCIDKQDFYNLKKKYESEGADDE